METGKFLYTPSLEVTFTALDIEVLWKLSREHYDYECRRQSEQGGLLWGLRNMLILSDGRRTATRTMDCDELDLLGKIAEDRAGTVAAPLSNPLYRQLHASVGSLNDEYRRWKWK